MVDALGEKHLFDAGIAGKTPAKADKAGGEEEVLHIEKRREEDLEFGAFGEDPFSAEMTARDEAIAREGIDERDELARLNPLLTELVDETLNTIRYGQSFGKERSERPSGLSTDISHRRRSVRQVHVRQTRYSCDLRRSSLRPENGKPEFATIWYAISPQISAAPWASH